MPVYVSLFSETIYTDQLYQVKDSLSSLFHLSVEVATNFASLIVKLAFDSLQEDDLRILTEGKFGIHPNSQLECENEGIN